MRRSVCFLTILLASALLAAGSIVLFQRLNPPPAAPDVGPFRSGSPVATATSVSNLGYVGSAACRRCHESEYDSWQRSFHRSMTQVPSAATVRAPWDGVDLQFDGYRYQLFTVGNEYWLRLPDPAVRSALERQVAAGQRPALPDIPLVERPLLLTTGSHHYQAYWVGTGRDNELLQVPFVYHLGRRAFLPRAAVFLQPASDPPHTPRWNSNCIQCHAVAGQPQHDLESETFSTRVAELGIACEACHGPAREHVTHRSRWWLPFGQALAEERDIVNPAKLGAAQSSEICGQCHSYFLPNDPDQWWESGFAGHSPPQSPLEETRQLLSMPPEPGQSEWKISAPWQSIFFADGTVRVGGREYNGLTQSRCHLDGREDRTLGCLHCHSMHGDDPAAQLRPEATTDEVCLQCHQPQAQYGAKHTKHPAESSGSRCVNCHMPRSAYALLRSIRSHRITRPSAILTAELGVPNACNLCHLDRPLSWAAVRLNRWTGGNQLPAAPVRDSGPPQIVLEALSAEAGVRALAVSALADPLLHNAAIERLRPTLLAKALMDPYAAIRFIAWRGLENLQLTDGLAFDSSVEPETQAGTLEQLQRRIRRGANSLQPQGSVPPWPQDEPQRALNENPTIPNQDLPWWLGEPYLAQLMANRDERPIRISE